MPASRFFLMLETAKRIRARENVDACYISRSSQMSLEGFDTTVKHFGNDLEKELPAKPPKPEERQEYVAPQDARWMLQNMFGRDPRIARRAHRVEH